MTKAVIDSILLFQTDLREEKKCFKYQLKRKKKFLEQQAKQPLNIDKKERAIYIQK